MAPTSTDGADSAPGLLSVVVPVCDEHETLPEFHRRLKAVLAALPFETETVFVNDGSRDGTLEVLRQLRASDHSLAIVDLSRNFGKEIALTAGIDHAGGEAIILVDADLQDPPELIPELIAPWRDEGYDVVYAQRIAREGETWLKKATASLFYRLMQRIGGVTIPEQAGEFRLLSRAAVDALGTLRERHRFMKGLYAWIGFPQKAVPYGRQPRLAGQTKWSYWGLWNLAVEGFTSFSVAPLRLASYVGLSVALIAFLYGLVIIYKTVVFGDPVAGYPSLMVTILFLGGVQLLALGVIGEYLGRVFNESKQRPLYLVKGYDPAKTSLADACPATEPASGNPPPAEPCLLAVRRAEGPAPVESEGNGRDGGDHERQRYPVVPAQTVDHQDDGALVQAQAQRGDQEKAW